MLTERRCRCPALFLTAALTSVPRLLRCFAHSLARSRGYEPISAKRGQILRALIDTYDTTLPTLLSRSRRAETRFRDGRLRGSRIRVPRGVEASVGTNVPWCEMSNCISYIIREHAARAARACCPGARKLESSTDRPT